MVTMWAFLALLATSSLVEGLADRITYRQFLHMIMFWSIDSLNSPKVVKASANVEEMT